LKSQDPFEIVLAHLDGLVRVSLRGDLDYYATLEHADALREVTDLRTRVVLDLAGLTFIDSAGIAFLAHLANTHDGPVRLENVPPIVRRTLTVTGLQEVFDFGSE
jgi:anti-sigma B factor antagonist